ncbi:MAG: magnetochrome domain-containing protein [SAR324 cluster bacterium]|nr:magnetochrome domain-containing protein [SAR324 cluster bacterium]
MNIAEWIMAAGVTFAISVLMFSVFQNDPWKDHVYEQAPAIVAGTPSPHKAGREKMACASCHAIVDPSVAGRNQIIPPIVDGAAIPISHKDGRHKQACSMCHQIISRKVAAETRKSTPAAIETRPNTPTAITVAQVQVVMPATPDAAVWDPEWHESFGLTRFQGKIVRIVEKAGAYQTDNINILVDNKISTPTWYNVAPGWFLQEQKCSLDFGMFVKGVAFQDMAATTEMQYVKTLSVNGQFCDIRDKEMIGFWETGAMFDEE